MWLADGNQDLQQIADEIGTLIIGLLVAMLVLVVVAALGAWLIIRRIRRSRLIGRAVVEAKIFLSPWGPAHEVGALRRDVAREADLTQRHLLESQRSGVAPGDVRGLLDSLTSVARSLDAELALLAREPAPRRRDLLPAARLRAQDFQTQMGTLRAALADDIASHHDAKAALLAENVQLAALTAHARRELNRSDS